MLVRLSFHAQGHSSSSFLAGWGARSDDETGAYKDIHQLPVMQVGDVQLSTCP